MSELFDVVDDHDCVLRRETRAEVHRQRLLHRAVHVLVFNSRGEVYLQRRSAKKDTYPNRWTTSCSGHVDAGEDYDTAVVRELAEELGLSNAEIGTRNAEMKTKATENAAVIEAAKDKKLKSPSSKTLPPSAFIIQPLLKYPPCRETGWEFIWIYTLTTDTPPTPDPGEISAGRWAAPAELDAWMARDPKAFTPSFILVWKLWREKNV